MATFAKHIAIRDDVSDHSSKAANHRIMTNTYELMCRRISAEIDIVSHLAMTTKRSILGKDKVITHNAIMRYMRGCHEHTIVTDDSLHIAKGCANMHGDMFANDVVIADD